MNLRLRAIRENLEITQKDIAKKLKVTPAYYNFLENGKRIIPLNHLNKICNIFKVSADYILGLSDYNFFPSKKYRLDKKLIGKRIKEVREKNNYTQQKLADFLNTTQSTISFYEKGETMVLTVFLYAMCEKFNVSIDYMMGRSNTKMIRVDEKPTYNK